MKQRKKFQKGDAGVTAMVVIMVVVLGFFGFQGMHSGNGNQGMHSGNGNYGSVDGTSQQEKTPQDLLDEIYARGEISREEYLIKREDLLKR